MFKITPNPTFSGQASLTVPGEEAPALITVTWRHQGRAALSKWLKRAAPGPASEASVGAQDVAWLGEVIADWTGPIGADGAAVPYTADNLGFLLDGYPAAGSELLSAYLRAMTESRAKN